MNHDELEEVRRRLEESRSLDETTARELLEPICRALRTAGITGLEARYEGYGDSGAVEELTVEPAGVNVPDELKELIDDWICAALPGGWEINDGSQGTVTIDVACCRAHFDHEFNVTDQFPFDIE